MNDTYQLFEQLVSKAYKKLLPNNTPTVSSVVRTAQDLIDRECYDVVYKEVNFKNITEEYVHEVLAKYRCIHSYFGTLYFDAQNVLFKDWLPSIKLLTGDTKSEK